MTDTSFDTLLLSRQDAIATITLNRPSVRNACNAQMCSDLIAAASLLAGDATVRVVLVRGAGKAFCAGLDLKEQQGLAPSERLARRVHGFTAYAAIERIPQAVIGIVHGPAFGSGCEIAGACDFVLASSDATFCYPEVARGIVGATQRLPRLAGMRMAKELLFTSRVFDAAEAKEIGLVNHVYKLEDLDVAAADMARRIALADPQTLRLTKRCVEQGLETTREGAMALELLSIEESLRNTGSEKS
ncbi:MAG TPA: enoyl-CoA hydratase/isomerase family protein [Noviherbaspirillum sp.]|jgi:enoyl-CoA hydratase|uniref:enoyl-CoA hydratase/isomerase family protein n=1 Tax=Noviherbaspirillum sp. TaxID=1926288 RepID=UPI002DDD3906|nr:enoyl-CoA hydratase/isomerase family protein [Noviherbaspirillum sp.]HEV2611308.1 enoyl-CoA hydratase/isomerase family protein [Noviherbaspirillum sp.]